jgi:hypothetical protein
MYHPCLGTAAEHLFQEGGGEADAGAAEKDAQAGQAGETEICLQQALVLHEAFWMLLLNNVCILSVFMQHDKHAALGVEAAEMSALEEIVAKYKVSDDDKKGKPLRQNGWM